MSPFDPLRHDLQAVQAGTLPIGTFAHRLRAFAVPASLPARYAEVLADLADRMESGALFSGESCSFSESDLLQAALTWIERAESASR